MIKSNSDLLPLGKLSADDFIKNYWQQRPLVIQQGFENFTSPISAEELAGLACEEGVHSRIVIEKGGERPWQLINGPMDEAIFASLPETHWTLLVNDVEKHVPELASIVDAFRFIPEWRVDDLMISFAPEGGTVGPHVDQYDVFILQAQGHRRWQVNSQSVDAQNQVANVDLKIQKDFTTEQEWLLKPGDLIYIPPGVSHYGVATDDCLSFSIGFRAPAEAEMLSDFIDYLCQDINKDKTYRDKNLILQTNPNEITSVAIENIREQFKQYLDPQHPDLARWFGRFVSDNKADVVFATNDFFADYASLKQARSSLLRNPASRFAFYIQEAESLLFVDGEDYTVSQKFSVILCEARKIELDRFSFSKGEQQFILSLYNNGQLV